MNDNVMRIQMIRLLQQKKSDQFNADKIGISLEDYRSLKQQLVEEYGSLKNIIDASRSFYSGMSESDKTEEETAASVFSVNLDEGLGFCDGLISDRPLSPEEIEAYYKIDKTRWKITSYRNRQHTNGKFLVSANVAQITGSSSFDPKFFQDSFKEFLEKTPALIPTQRILSRNFQDTGCCLILPKQDAHFNKYDIMGDNNINSRFDRIITATEAIVQKAARNTFIEETVYVVGSDQFNSEFTGLTTKGTPQQNILTYEGAFQVICQHEVDIISMLISNSEKVIVKFIPGNHDQYVGWHLVSWLQAHFRNHTSVSFDTAMLNRKYHQYGTCAVMFNHGDVMKFSQLAGVFPMEYKDMWSKSENFYIFTGDKHHEKSDDINGIKVYQIPQLSSARSFWDDKKGYTVSKPEMTGFILTKDNGMSDILKVPM